MTSVEPTQTTHRSRRGETRPSTQHNGGSASTPTAPLPKRKTPAHPPVLDSGNRSPIVFLTVCAKDRHRKLACDRIHRLLPDAWDNAGHWRVGRYVVMPDHLHLFCEPGTWPPTPVKAWANYWKGLVTRTLKGHGSLADATGRGGTRPSTKRDGGSASTPTVPDTIWPSPFWQRDCWDTQLRRGENYHDKWEYVRRNPVRAGLCTEPEQWPFQGCINDLLWHD